MSHKKQTGSIDETGLNGCAVRPDGVGRTFGRSKRGPKDGCAAFDLVLQKKEEDFYIGASKPSPAEQERLKTINAELAKF